MNSMSWPVIGWGVFCMVAICLLTGNVSAGVDAFIGTMLGWQALEIEKLKRQLKERDSG